MYISPMGWQQFWQYELTDYAMSLANRVTYTLLDTLPDMLLYQQENEFWLGQMTGESVLNPSGIGGSVGNPGFANGAATAAMGYLFNAMMTEGANDEKAPVKQTDDKEQWKLRGTIEVYGTTGRIVTGPNAVKVAAFDTAASPHVRNFAYEFTVAPAEHQGMWVSPVYEGYAVTGAYGAIGTQTIYPGDANYQQLRWTFKIVNTASSGCDNCGQPALKIYERIP